MLGRFFSFSYLLSLIILLKQFNNILSINYKKSVLIILSIYSIFYYHTPLNSPIHYEEYEIIDGIADERGYYFKELSLIAYINSTIDGSFFPNHPWAIGGKKLKNRKKMVFIGRNIGLFGYYLGVNKIVVDIRGLSDPLLARLPCKKRWRIGHYPRKIPDGYIESLKSGKNKISSRKLSEYYEKLKIITTTPIFSYKRFKTIILFNLGLYTKSLR